MIIPANILSSLTLLMSVLFLIQHKVLNFALFAKLAGSALSPVWALLGAAGAVIGWNYQAFWPVLIGVLDAGMMSSYIWQCTRDHKGFELAFDSRWSDQIPHEQAERLLMRRWSIYLKLKTSPESILERDVAFWTLPNSERQLLCDIWRHAGNNVSGIGAKQELKINTLVVPALQAALCSQNMTVYQADNPLSVMFVS